MSTHGGIDDQSRLSSQTESQTTYIGKTAAEERADRRHGGGTGDGGGELTVRVAKLEAHMEHMQTDVSEIKGLIGGLAAQFTGLTNRIEHLPTKQDLSHNLLAIVAVGLTVLVIVVGGIVGGLEFIQYHASSAPAAAASPPLIFQLPAPAQLNPAIPMQTSPSKRPHG